VIPAQATGNPKLSASNSCPVKHSGDMAKRDLNQIAASIVAQSTGEKKATLGSKPEKNAAAVALGRLGGLKGGRARADSLSTEQRSEIAKKAASARWSRNEAG
jgi:hypothetical protein